MIADDPSRPARGSGPLRRWVARSAARGVAHLARASGHRATSLPGLVARRIAPGMLTAEAERLTPLVLVAGTNGKTTTSRLLARILQAAIGDPVVNASGANLPQSIASALLADPERQADDGSPRPAVLEVDEMALEPMVRELRPDVVVMTNLFRDQLDRYGEVDAIVRRWRSVAGELPIGTRLITCADDPRLAMLVRGAPARALTFGYGPLGGDRSPNAAAREAPGSSSLPDPVACDDCGRPLVSEQRTIGHLGRFRCPAGHIARRAPDLAFDVRPDGDGSDLRIRAGGVEAAFRFSLSGIAFAYDAAAAATAALAVGIPLPAVASALDGATPAFGRSERFDVDGRSVVLCLTKNPASLADAVDRAEQLRPAVVLFALNDAHADGRDVSWIWDSTLDALLTARTLVLAGARADDLALRLKYDRLTNPTWVGSGPDARVSIAGSTDEALDAAVEAARPGESVLLVATYTAMLDFRRRFEERGLASIVG